LIGLVFKNDIATLGGVDGRLDLAIREEIRNAGGAIPFERYMEMALYAPGLGFYERPEHGPGIRGDFITSVSVGPLFGALLAWRMAAWSAQIEGPVRWIEAGAHDGRLAGDILKAAAALAPALVDRLEYWIVEPSAVRRGWQEATLSGTTGRVRWFSSVEEIAAMRPRGIWFVNELLDAFPIRRWVWNRAKAAWLLWAVESGEAGFVGTTTPPERFGLNGAEPSAPEVLKAVLPDGFTFDEAPAAAPWWGGAVAGLKSGWALTFDYHLSFADRLHPARAGGVLRTYQRHRTGGDPLASPGEQDLTAPADLESAALAGEAVGAKTEALSEQGLWLSAVLRDAVEAAPNFFAWTPALTRQFQMLTHPNHLGRQFKVLVQSVKARGAAAPV
jgi:SAM-dependent MidA family methyltransferase